MDKKGFTLIEILVVLAITAVLSGVAIVYSHVGQSQINLSVEESKIAELILQAKELSVATYSTSALTCAYGVRFDYASSTYTLFEYNSATPTGGGRDICPSIASTSKMIVPLANMPGYKSGSTNVHVAQGVKLINAGAASDTIQDVLFYPPDPCTMISLDKTTFVQNCVPNIGFPLPPAEVFVYLQTVDGSQSRTISVSPSGQVSL